jgi:hypothetical protein
MFGRKSNTKEITERIQRYNPETEVFSVFNDGGSRPINSSGHYDPKETQQPKPAVQ